MASERTMSDQKTSKPWPPAVNVGGITTGENLKPGEVAPGKTAKGDLIFYVYTDVPNLQLAWTAADGKTRLLQVSR